MGDCAKEIVAIASEKSLRVGNPQRSFGGIQRAFIARMRAIDDEGKNTLAPELVDLGADPSWLISPGEHFPIPQNGELALNLGRLDAMRDPGAGTAAIDGEHQARLFH